MVEAVEADVVLKLDASAGLSADAWAVATGIEEPDGTDRFDSRALQIPRPKPLDVSEGELLVTGRRCSLGGLSHLFAPVTTAMIRFGSSVTAIVLRERVETMVECCVARVSTSAGGSIFRRRNASNDSQSQP